MNNTVECTCCHGKGQFIGGGYVTLVCQICNGTGYIKKVIDENNQEENKIDSLNENTQDKKRGRPSLKKNKEDK